MTETLTPPLYNREDSTEESGIDTRIPSPTGRVLERAAVFLQDKADRVQQRAIVNEHSSAHTEALAEYREQNRGAYTDHLTRLSSPDNTNQPAREFGQRELHRENRREHREEMLDKAKSTMRKFGRSALNKLGKAGLITLGLGVIAGETAVKSTREAAKSAKVNIQSRRNERARAKQERADALRREAELRARAAAERKQARRERWAKRREGVAEKYNSVASFTKAQKGRLGHLAARAHASGQAAIDTWKNY